MAFHDPPQLPERLDESPWPLFTWERQIQAICDGPKLVTPGRKFTGLRRDNHWLQAFWNQVLKPALG
jgi:hypothetical protein